MAIEEDRHHGYWRGQTKTKTVELGEGEGKSESESERRLTQTIGLGDDRGGDRQRQLN